MSSTKSNQTSFKKGLIPWNKGMKMSEEHREKLREAHKHEIVVHQCSRCSKILKRKNPSMLCQRCVKIGRKQSEEAIRNRSLGLKGHIVTEETRRKHSQRIKENPIPKTPESCKKGVLIGTQVRYRNNPTPQEKALYDYLLLKGIIFEKQEIIGDKMVVDVYIPFLNLVIEVDGKEHTTKRCKLKDMKKEKYLKEAGIKILRLTNEEVESGKFKERLVV